MAKAKGPPANRYILPPPVYPCLTCARVGAGPSGMCAACEAQLVPGRAPGGWNQTNLLAFQAQAAHQQAVSPLPKDDARRVDLVGWRLWRITALGYLQAITADSIYMPGVAMVAHKEIGDHQGSGSGVHVFKDMDGAAKEMQIHAEGARTLSLALGTVQLWGDVVEHERGYRAERAMIRSIDGVVLPNKSAWDSEPAKALAFLRDRYGVGAHVPPVVTEATGEDTSDGPPGG